MATLAGPITHDSGPPLTDHWTSVADVNSRMSVTVAAALGGSVEGMQCTQNTGFFNTFVNEPFVSPASNELRLRFRFDPNGPPIPTSGTIDLVSVGLNTGGLGSAIIDMILSVRPGDGFIRATLGYRTDLGPITQSTVTVTDSDMCIELAVVRAANAGSNDGSVEWFVDGVSQDSVAGVDNFDLFPTIDSVSVSWQGWDVEYAAQIAYLDEVLLTDNASTGLCVAVFTPTLAPMTRPVDIDADGSNLYLALLDSGNPILIKMATSLDADGSTVFTPGAGDDIGVQCGRFNADVVWVAGAFDGTNVVEKSEDGGTIFTVKDPATFGDVEAFVVGPDSDDRVLIADDNIDIQETLDDGTTWAAINSGTGFNVNAIARLPQNVQESVFGNDAGANDNIDFSPNSGADMEDFSTGFPTEDATRVIVN